MQTKATLIIKNWYADRVRRSLAQELADEINRTADMAVEEAQQRAPVDTGFMRDTMRVIRYATPDNLTAEWGNDTATYTIWVEIGSQGRPGRYFMRQSQQVATSGLTGRVRGILK